MGINPCVGGRKVQVVLKKCRTLCYKVWDIPTGSRVGRQTANMWNVFEFRICMYVFVPSEGVSLLPGGKAFISYLQAQTGALIFSHIFLTPLCSPNTWRPLFSSLSRRLSPEANAVKSRLCDRRQSMPNLKNSAWLLSRRLIADVCCAVFSFLESKHVSIKVTGVMMRRHLVQRRVDERSNIRSGVKWVIVCM